MTPAELMATRESLGLDRRSAALLVGVSARTWRSWETDPTWQMRRGVPVDVVDALSDLREAVTQYVREHEDQDDEVLVCYRNNAALRAAHADSTMPAVTYLLVQAQVADRIAGHHLRKPPRLVWSDLRAGDRAVVLDGYRPRLQATMTSAEFVAYRVQLGVSQNWVAAAVGVTDKAIYDWGKGALLIPHDVTKLVFTLVAHVNHVARPGAACETYRNSTEPITLLCHRDTHQVAYDPDGRYVELPPPAHRGAQLRVARALREAGHDVILEWAPLEIKDL